MTMDLLNVIVKKDLLVTDVKFKLICVLCFSHVSMVIAFPQHQETIFALVLQVN